MFSLEEELKQLPDSPGVYFMRDSHDNIIYVGKAISLRNRVRSYFRKGNKSPKIEKMVTHIARFEYILTDSDLEAFILECNMIKKYTPKYNTMLKDGKTYPYIRVTLGEPFPRFSKVREVKQDKSRYFGPYVNVTAVNETLDLLRKLYGFRTCNRVLPRDIGKERPCLYYHIKQCSGPCAACISSEKYREMVKEAMQVLEGNDKEIVKNLTQKMNRAAEEMRYEDAAIYRDQIRAVQTVAQKQKITNNNNREDRDIIAYNRDQSDAVVSVFFIRDGKLMGREHFHLEIAEEESGGAILAAFIKQYYNGSPFVPKEIFTKVPVEEQKEIQEWLSQKRGNKVRILSPSKGSNAKMVLMAEKNAKLIVEKDKEKLKLEEAMTTGAVKQICQAIQIPVAHRMEAYDISNISGFESVGSMIVFQDGKPKRNDYRKFKIKTVKGPNDYASMKEVLSRRFLHGLKEREELDREGKDYNLGNFTKFPDILMMDGGRGQVNIALEVLKELGLEIPVCGMVKDDHHRTRGLYYNNQEIPLDTHSGAFKLITQMQDEAHRFAIEYHRSLRSKGQVHSVLDDIPGIGPARRKALLRKFKSAEAVSQASLEELENTETMTLTLAKEVYDFFHL